MYHDKGPRWLSPQADPNSDSTRPPAGGLVVVWMVAAANRRSAQGFELSGLGQQDLARLVDIVHLAAVGMGVLRDEVDVLADVLHHRLLLLRRRRDLGREVHHQLDLRQYLMQAVRPHSGHRYAGLSLLQVVLHHPFQPFRVRWIWPMLLWICSVALWVRVDRVRTSSATTAKPRPCSPARAASMAALSASRLV